MKEQILALALPGFPSASPINSPANAQFNSLGSIVSGFLDVALYISGFLLLIWLVWGIFQYLFAGGSKEGLGAARKRITYALIGFIVLIFAFFAGDYAKELIKPKDPSITPISAPESPVFERFTPPPPSASVAPSSSASPVPSSS